MADYIIVQGTGEGFLISCSRNLAEGYLPAGGIQLNGTLYLQAFYKPDIFQATAVKEPDVKKPSVKKAVRKKAVREK